MIRRLPPLLAALLVTACTPALKPPAPSQPVASSLPSSPAAATDWRDLPLTIGDWRYTAGPDGSTASFGGTAAAPLFTLRCDRSRHAVVLARPGATAATMTVRTSYGTQDWPGQLTADGIVTVVLAAADPALDRIAFSRGRFSVALSGTALLVLPARAEPGRVVEDCR